MAFNSRLVSFIFLVPNGKSAPLSSKTHCGKSLYHCVIGGHKKTKYWPAGCRVQGAGHKKNVTANDP